VLGVGPLADEMRAMIAADPDRYRPEMWTMSPVGECPCCGQDVYRCTTRHTGWAPGFATQSNRVHPSFNPKTKQPEPGGPLVGCCCVPPNWSPKHREQEPPPKAKRKRTTKRKASR
jgi:hypothetical protein